MEFWSGTIRYPIKTKLLKSLFMVLHCCLIIQFVNFLVKINIDLMVILWLCFGVMSFTGGIVHEKGLLPQDLPPWLTKITKKINEESCLYPSPINHVLINEYLPNQGIMPHQDGPAYFPVVAILSLGSPVVMDFTPHYSLIGNTSNIDDRGSAEGTDYEHLQNHHPFSVALMPGSLLIFKDTAYSDYLHGIKDCEIHQYDMAVNANEVVGQQSVVETRDEDLKAIRRSATRVSLTCRVVSKVHRNLFRF